MIDKTLISTFKNRLEGIDMDDTPAVVRRKSRDFYWYSPVLKRDLDQVTGDILVTPRSQEEVVRIVAAAYECNIPITTRGAGTGNYGQAMPLAGGIVLDMTLMDQTLEVGPGYVIAQAGALMGHVNAAARSQSGQELRMIPSTYRTASIGGFIAGGSGGVGSIRWGGLRDAGNVIRVRLVTMEATPKIIDLTGGDVAKVTHAYGTNGIITECEVPLTASYDWVDMIVAFDEMDDAVFFADELSRQDGILIKELSVMGPNIGHLYFVHYRPYIEPDKAVCLILVAPQALESLMAFIKTRKGDCVFRSDKAKTESGKALPPLIEHTWNHTTLVARRAEPSLTYLQVLYPYPNHVESVAKMKALLGDEILEHLEFSRFEGRAACFSLTMVRYTSEERLDEVIQIFEDNGCLVFNPHRVTLEEGGMKKSDLVQLGFKKEVDPKGLLNPGKMIAWDNPDFDFSSSRKYLF